MKIDDPTLAERTFTETHDRILHALVEQMHDMSLRLAALEAAAQEPGERTNSRLAPPAVPGQQAPSSEPRTVEAPSARPSEPSPTKTRVANGTRAAGWQPARR